MHLLSKIKLVWGLSQLAFLHVAASAPDCAHDCCWVVHLWKDLGQETDVDPASSTACCGVLADCNKEEGVWRINWAAKGLKGDVPSYIGNLDALTYLSFYINSISSIPAEIGQLKQLRTFHLHSNLLTSIPKEIGQLDKLVTLNFPGNRISSLPEEIGGLVNLGHWDFSSNQIVTLPASIKNLKKLRTLIAHHNMIEELPAEFGELEYLQHAHFHGNKLSTLGEEIGQLKNLLNLNLYGNQFTTLPDSIQQLELDALNIGGMRMNSYDALAQAQIRKLIVTHASLKVIPEAFSQITSLTHLTLYANNLESITPITNSTSVIHLDLRWNGIQHIPSEIAKMTQLEELHLYSNRIQTLPGEFGQLNKLMVLNLGGNPLVTLPTEFGNLKNLWKLSIYETNLQVLPSGIGQLSNLSHLSLRDNKLIGLPKEICELKDLQIATLSRNAIRELPNCMAGMANLQIINADSNDLNEIPREIGEMPNMQILNLAENNLTNLPSAVLFDDEIKLINLAGNTHFTCMPSGGLGRVTDLSVPPCQASEFRFVTVRRKKLYNEHYLHLREIEVYSDGTNVALGKNTTQSSILREYLEGDKVVNGNLEDTFHSKNNDVEWVQIDLGQFYAIDKVVIYNVNPDLRHAQRARNLRIILSEKSDMSHPVFSEPLSMTKAAYSRFTWHVTADSEIMADGDKAE
jgi:Leucine-rich repeat (LRR) protein